MSKYDVIKKAYNEKYAIPHFNILGLTYARYILEECENQKSPVILGVSEKAVNFFGGFNVVYNSVSSLIKDLNITVPVILHLDHGKSVEACEKALDAGFDGAMLDFSLKPLEENIKSTKYLVDKYKDKIIESEVGAIGKEGNKGIVYAEVEDAIKLSNETGAHIIAVALGSVHGPYKGEPCINFERMIEVNNALNKPLVMHGGSGLSDEIFKKCTKYGIAKINISTELKQAHTRALRKFLNEHQEEYDPIVIEKSTEEEIKKVVNRIINVFGSNNKA